VTFYAGIFAAGKWFGGWLASEIDLSPGSLGKGWTGVFVWTALVVYILLLALPFVPGVEISVALFAAFGSAIALPIYVATVVALTLSFIVGRMIPPHVLARLFGLLGLSRARDLVLRLAPLSPDERLAVLLERAPGRLAPTLIDYRYLAVVVSLNIPGNAVIGGGGGIGLLAGLSGLFSTGGYMIAIVIAVLPVPLTIALAGHLW
jgi:hypothetical protein